jgi:hypothetical protein
LIRLRSGGPKRLRKRSNCFLVTSGNSSSSSPSGLEIITERKMAVAVIRGAVIGVPWSEKMTERQIWSASLDFSLRHERYEAQNLWTGIAWKQDLSEKEGAGSKSEGRGKGREKGREGGTDLGLRVELSDGAGGVPHLVPEGLPVVGLGAVALHQPPPQKNK